MKGEYDLGLTISYKKIMLIYSIFKNTDSTDDINAYNEQINKFAEEIAHENYKGKRPLIITGSGISSSVPNMNKLMEKLKKLIENYDSTWKKSRVFIDIFDDCYNSKTRELHQNQSRLLTYIQNAYMGKTNYVYTSDVEPLADIWNQFIIWLIYGDEYDSNLGILNAKPSKNHMAICDMYEKMNAFSITTNFDNLLQKAFNKKGANAYPILDIDSFDNYFLSDISDNSFIEIQSRGDVFWLECSGNKSKICLNRHRQCFVPGENVKKSGNNIVCNLCGSDAKIYFAFPGTKEKDSEMSIVINGVWKYLANSISHIIIIGSSMDYDPVLIEFLRELLRRRKIRILYISRLKTHSADLPNTNNDYTEIYKKEVTKFLFSAPGESEHIWARAKETEEILYDLLDLFCKAQKNIKPNNFSESELDNFKEFFKLKKRQLFEPSVKFNDFIIELQGSLFIPELWGINEIIQMKHFSQLGLKTFWINGPESPYQEHNRLKHSIGVMIIASYLYFEISPNPNKNELIFLQIAALLHDLGHLPFSHLLEEVFDEFGWIPVGEINTFNHEQHTKRLIEKLYNDNADFKNILDNTGYSINDLIMLIDGNFGKGYLDALINSPIDCDKIEYLFSDSIFMGRGTKADFINFINGLEENLSVNENNFLVIKENSTKSFLKLISMRGEMYDQVYLRRGLRYLEACCKLIIRTFIVYKCAAIETFETINDTKKFNDFFNLSESKIEVVINFMVDCLKNIGRNQVCEIQILNKMVEEINNNIVISDVMKETVNKCMELIKESHSNSGITKIEKDFVITYEVSNTKFDDFALKKLLKTVYLRFPGVILVDYVKSKSSFSFGNYETRKRRSDGTTSSVENIIIKDIAQAKGKVDTKFICLGDSAELVNRQLNYSDHSYINIYRITDNSFRYMQAEDYILSELRKAGIIYEK